MDSGTTSRGELVSTDPATAINEAHRAVQGALVNAVEHAIRAGELLLAQKVRMRHGEFRGWIETHCECSQRAASLYMKAAQWVQAQKQLENGSALPLCPQSLRALTALLPRREPATRPEGDAPAGEVPDEPDSSESESPPPFLDEIERLIRDQIPEQQQATFRAVLAEALALYRRHKSNAKRRATRRANTRVDDRALKQRKAPQPAGPAAPEGGTRISP